MEKEFVPYEIAVELKILGFADDCLGYWVDKFVDRAFIEFWHGLSFPDDIKGRYNQASVIPAILYQQAFRWFRDKGYRVGVFPDFTDCGLFAIEVFGFGGFLFDTDYDYKTHEEAELACLKKLIEIAKTR